MVKNLSFDSRNLADRLDRISDRHVLAFGIWQLDRMIPNFAQFCIDTQSNGASLLKYVSCYGWRVLETGNQYSHGRIELKTLEDICPDTEEHESIYTSSALDAVISAINLVRFIGEKGNDLIVEMSSLARDSADIFVQNILTSDYNAADFEESIRLHPIMQRELEEQEEDLRFLEGLHTEGMQFFTTVLQRSLIRSFGEPWLQR